MNTIDKKTLRFLSHMGFRGALGQAVYDYAKDGKNFYAVSADLAHASGFDRIKSEFPDKLINVGIAEQNLVGVSAGLSMTGIPVIATTWGMFASVRVADQVRNFLGYMQSNVKLIGMDSGFVQSKFSYSHTNPPDIAIMRSIPGITIISPCDSFECYKAIISALNYKGPIYIRLTGDGYQPMIYKDPQYTFEIGKSVTLKEGKDVALISCGSILNEVLKVANTLEELGISTMVINMHTIKPLDKEKLCELLDKKLIVTIEDHLKSGGLGSAVAEYFSCGKNRPRHLLLGVDDFFPKTGSIEYVKKVCFLQENQISRKIIEEYNYGDN